MNTKLTALLATVALMGGVAQSSAATLSFVGASFPGTGVPLAVTGSDGTVFTFASDADSQFENFGTFLTEGSGRTAPITVTFSQPIFSIALPVSSDRVGDSPYTSTVSFFDGTTQVDSITLMGNTLNSAEVFNYRGAITSAVISTSVDPQFAPFGYTQNIGSFSYNLSAVPLPASAPLFGAALVALGAVGYGVGRKNAASAA